METKQLRSKLGSAKQLWPKLVHSFLAAHLPASLSHPTKRTAEACSEIFTGRVFDKPQKSTLCAATPELHNFTWLQGALGGVWELLGAGKTQHNSNPALWQRGCCCSLSLSAQNSVVFFLLSLYNRSLDMWFSWFCYFCDLGCCTHQRKHQTGMLF